MIDTETVWLKPTSNWLTYSGLPPPNIIQHINTIYAEKELTPTATTRIT